MEGTLPEGDIKRAIREDFAAVTSVVVLAADTGSGVQFFPFLSIPVFGEGLFGVRKARTLGLVSFTQMTPLIAKLRADPIPDITGGFAWKGAEFQVVFPGSDVLKGIPAAERWWK